MIVEWLAEMLAIFAVFMKKIIGKSIKNDIKFLNVTVFV